MNLIRASLEMDNSESQQFGIDPLSDRRRWVLVLRALMYKAKIFATNFIAKAIARRLFGRVLGRSLIELVAVPVFATPLLGDEFQPCSAR